MGTQDEEPISESVVRLYPNLIDLTYRVVNSLKGRQTTDPRALGLQYPAMKIFLHAASINQLRQGTNVTLSDYPAGAYILDFPSLLVIVRSMMETYLNLFEVYFEPTSEDLFEYRHAVYELRGFKIREEFPPKNPKLAEEYQRKLGSIKQLRGRIRNTAFFHTLNKDQQKSTLEGKMYPKRTLQERVRAAGLDESLVSQAYAYLSAYVHGDALSAAQIVDADDAKTMGYIQFAVNLASQVLLKMIEDYTLRFPEARRALRPGDHGLAEFWQLKRGE